MVMFGRAAVEREVKPQEVRGFFPEQDKIYGQTRPPLRQY